MSKVAEAEKGSNKPKKNKAKKAAEADKGPNKKIAKKKRVIEVAAGTEVRMDKLIVKKGETCKVKGRGKFIAKEIIINKGGRLQLGRVHAQNLSKNLVVRPGGVLTTTTD